MIDGFRGVDIDTADIIVFLGIEDRVCKCFSRFELIFMYAQVIPVEFNAHVARGPGIIF